MLILYPTTYYDAFISIANCDAFLTANILATQRVLYDALIDADKEILIRQATRLIKSRITLPDTLESDLQYATAYLVNYSVNVDMTNENTKGNVKIKEIAGLVKTEYFTQNESSNSFPDIVESLLSQYAITSSSGVFTFNRG